MPISREKWLAIKQAIEDAHNALVVNYIDPRAVRSDVLARLKKLGLVDVKGELLKDSYLLGQVLAAEAKRGSTGNDLTLKQVQASLAANPVRLSDSEQRAVEMANARAAQYVTGLGNRIAQRTGEVIINADQRLRTQLRQVIGDATEESILQRRSVKELRSDIYHATGDGTRDLDRIAITEKQTAMQEGYAAALTRQAKGRPVRVIKRVAPTCCVHCFRLYCEPDGTPRAFDLAELEANGTNVGRKVGEWLPVVAATHPHCTCTLVRMPAGYAFNAKNEMVPAARAGAADADEQDESEKSLRREVAKPRLTLRKAKRAAPSAPPRPKRPSENAVPPRTPVL